MKIFLIRHGQTTGDVEDRYGGDYDDHLTKLGKTQAKGLAKNLKNKKIEIIFHSPLIRAKETTKILNEELNVKTKELKELKERNNYGVLTGLEKSRAVKLHPEEVDKINKNKIHHDVKNSESYKEFKERINHVYTSLEKQNYNVIAVITHGGVISTIVREILKLGEFKKLGDCGYIEIDDKKLVSLENAELK